MLSKATNLSGFNTYCLARAGQYRQANQKLQSRDIARLVARDWRMQSKADRANWEARAREVGLGGEDKGVGAARFNR